MTNLVAPASPGPATPPPGMLVPGGAAQSTNALDTDRPAPRPLTRAEKAAVIVRLLSREGGELPLTDLDAPMQARLAQAMGRMSYVDRTTLAHVIREFAEELHNVGLPMPRGLVGALDAIEDRLDPRTAARLRKEAGVRQAGDPWARLRVLDVGDLRPLAEGESIEVAAVLLAKLPTAKAAELLAELPGERARRIAYAISMTDAITPEAVDRIGFSLAARFDNRPDRAFDGKPEERVGEILNFSASATRDEVLSGLEETDQGFAENVRRAIFTFAHIPERVEPRDLPRAVREVEQADLVTALTYAAQSGDEAAADFVLENISQRLADGIRDEIGERGKVARKDGEMAMGLVVAAIRQLVAEGEITLRQPDEEDEG